MIPSQKSKQQTLLVSELLIDADEDSFISAEDCDDNDASVNPSATELCDGLDNDCDGETDEEYIDDDEGNTINIKPFETIWLSNT